MEISRNVVDPGGYPRPLSGATALKYRKPRNGNVELSGRSTGKRYGWTQICSVRRKTNGTNRCVREWGGGYNCD